MRQQTETYGIDRVIANRLNNADVLIDLLSFGEIERCFNSLHMLLIADDRLKFFKKNKVFFKNQIVKINLDSA